MPSPQADPEVAAILGVEGGTRRRAWWLAAAAAALVAALAITFLSSRDTSDLVRYETEPVTRGDVTVSVSATGNLQPTNQVDVGSELSGLVDAVLVQENEQVKQGQVLARLDTSKLVDAIVKSKAALASTEAKVQQTTATVKEARASLERLRVVSRLSGGKVPSKTEMEIAEATLARAIADEASARAAVAEGRAVLSSDDTNLAKASIRSPIDGVVLARKIEPGQTVAASFNTPVLFTLAQDLSQMELQVSVDEADVGQVKEDQDATFGVDAYPGRRFPARIRRVGLGSQTKDGVVTYKTILVVDNADLTLRPGMTAVADVTTATRHDVLLVPTAALRFTPPTVSEARPKPGGGILGKLLPRPPVDDRPRASGSAAKSDVQRVWVLRSGRPTAVNVTIGVTDGRHAELVAGNLESGTPVITDGAVPSS